MDIYRNKIDVQFKSNDVKNRNLSIIISVYYDFRNKILF